MYNTIKAVAGGAFFLILILSKLARRFPNVEWLQVFRNALPRVSEEQRARTARRATVYAGLQLILFGIALPIGYVALTVMMFNEITRKAMSLVLAGSALCFVLGIVAIWHSRQR